MKSIPGRKTDCAVWRLTYLDDGCLQAAILQTRGLALRMMDHLIKRALKTPGSKETTRPGVKTARSVKRGYDTLQQCWIGEIPFYAAPPLEILAAQAE